MHRCPCRFVPDYVLDRLASDQTLSKETCERVAYTARLTQHFCDIRKQNIRLAGFLMENQWMAELTSNPEVTLFDCRQTVSLPGLQIKDPANSKDPTVQRTHSETDLMGTFLREVFARNSIDNAGMTLMSAVHYGKKYNNAMWNGLQMIYGDGDGELFLSFASGIDVIGHELAHGLTQYTLQLEYDDEPGGLNESLSDCFGTMFRQWRLNHDAKRADWLVGSDIIGPRTRERGYTCMRDMCEPDAKHCLAPQPTHYGQLKPGQHPHSGSGPPNLAFCTACKLVGGNSWENIGRIWYQAMAKTGLAPRMGMAQFAAKTREQAADLFGKDSLAEAAVDAGWKKVGL
ncbi:M4 family metallopeptidase [Comamonas endophytica]|uniref:Neutral metalloproteinase n=1 Tax=Comamonas endophytica TaxID=2949090 RepID=A0ABY6GH17_9BURK|nr:MULTISPECIES: M4 family metallopeptidase [unclassified Acidovorax]MCD2514372.1 M4 family metallopeptidase [Acidovorax sp. D4N7]UYG53615.1 M4 family metallopeptidase [Acidovorax sp. 5MLIR]UYG53662.1 M4 family metallopeptidase [Acidovorax sp. 5MLIR]